MNGDDKTDIVVANRSIGTLALFFQTDRGVFDGTAPAVLRGLSTPSHVDVVDVDGDGNSDIVTGLTIFYQSDTTPGDFEQRPPLTLGSASPYYGSKLLIEDLNGDGTLDLLASAFNGTSVHYQRADGTFASPVPLPGVERNAAVGDLDADGDLDIVSAKGDP